MNRLILSSLAVVISCGSGAVFADEDTRVFQTAEIQASDAPPGSGMFTTAEGAAWLKRTEDRVDGRVMAKVDTADQPYTIWWVIFNNPDGCIASCGPADLADGGVAADVAIFNASGAISAATGNDGGVINVDLSVIAGEGVSNGSQDSPCPAPFCQPGRGLREENGLCAEIHVDINRHVFSGDWVQELTYPELPQAFAIFPPAEECSDDDDDSDSDSDSD